MTVTVHDLLLALEREFPVAWAEPWDNVGLLVGDRDAEVRGVFVSLDVTARELTLARDAGANVLLTHHPAFLTAPETLSPGPGAAGLAYTAASEGIALIACHTNLDRSPVGASSLAAALGLPEGRAVERSLQPITVVSTFVPTEALDTVASAMVQAGAGRIGLYEGCSFSSAGTGRFTSPHGSAPHEGRPGETTSTAEERLEMVCALSDGLQVAEAARRAHPYEEPLIMAIEGGIARGAARLGRVCDLAQPLTLGGLARLAAETFGVTPRVWGDPDAVVGRVATATGSAGGLIKDVCASGADALVAGEVRYHDALSASRDGLAIVELGHDVSEWPLVPVLADVARSACADVQLTVDTPRPAWWTP